MRAPWSLSTLHIPFLVGRWPLERISHLSRRLLIQGRFDVEAIRCGQNWRLLTHIGFTLQQPSAVSLQVFNTHGQLVATLVEGTRPAGTYQAAWDGRDGQGQAVSSGTYIVRLDAAGQQPLAR